MMSLEMLVDIALLLESRRIHHEKAIMERIKECVRETHFGQQAEVE
jgi:hypothetical protein